MIWDVTWNDLTNISDELLLSLEWFTAEKSGVRQEMSNAIGILFKS